MAIRGRRDYARKYNRHAAVEVDGPKLEQAGGYISSDNFYSRALSALMGKEPGHREPKPVTLRKFSWEK